METLDEIEKRLQNGRIDEVILMLRHWIRHSAHPDDRAYYLLGNAYRKKGDFSQALNCYTEAETINPDSPAAEAHLMLMNIMEYYHKDYYNP